MLSEEKKAINLLKTYQNKLVYEIKEKDKKAVNIVLKLIIKLQKENKYMHQELDKQQTIINNYAKENEEKDKQIDLMGEVIFKRFAAHLIIEYGIENKEQFIKCFENKVKEDKENE